jgi:hypothetical protein
MIIKFLGKVEKASFLKSEDIILFAKHAEQPSRLALANIFCKAEAWDPQFLGEDPHFLAKKDLTSTLLNRATKLSRESAAGNFYLVFYYSI